MSKEQSANLSVRMKSATTAENWVCTTETLWLLAPLIPLQIGLINPIHSLVLLSESSSLAMAILLSHYQVHKLPKREERCNVVIVMGWGSWRTQSSCKTSSSVRTHQRRIFALQSIQVCYPSKSVRSKAKTPLTWSPRVNIAETR